MGGSGIACGVLVGLVIVVVAKAVSDNDPGSPNLEFFLGRRTHRSFTTTGLTIDEMHTRRGRDMQWLEASHDYIQWLFPIDEQGMSYLSWPLQTGEAQAIAANADARTRLRRSYAIMLNFFGFRLADLATGRVERSGDASHCAARLKNLNESFHNYLRITRITKSLGLLGLPQYQAPFVRALVEELVLADGHLRGNTVALDSCRRFWLPAVLDGAARRDLETLLARIDGRIDGRIDASPAAGESIGDSDAR